MICCKEAYKNLLYAPHVSLFLFSNAQQLILREDYPPWDRVIRVGIIAKGNKANVTVFDTFKIENQEQ